MACWAWPRRCRLIVLDKWLTNLKLFHSYVILAKLVIFAHDNAMFLTCSPFSRRVCFRLISCWTRVYIMYTWGGFWNVHLLMTDFCHTEVTLYSWQDVKIQLLINSFFYLSQGSVWLKLWMTHSWLNGMRTNLAVRWPPAADGTMIRSVPLASPAPSPPGLSTRVMPLI